jgi:hypothetical protein
VSRAVSTGTCARHRRYLILMISFFLREGAPLTVMTDKSGVNFHSFPTFPTINFVTGFAAPAFVVPVS